MNARDPAQRTVTFHRIYADAIPPMRADRSALGSIPAAAHQYCEALCTASAFGWYVFPPADIRLKWNGAEAFIDVDGEWELLRATYLPGFEEYWDEHCPEDLQGRAPPYISPLFVPGIVQIWSGILVSTAADWSVLVRPPANIAHSRSYSCFEGIVETDRFQPCPLFINIRLHATETVIEIPQMKPLMQLQPIHRSCYGEALTHYGEFEGLAPDESGLGGLDDSAWNGFRRTVRSTEPVRDAHDTGQYAVSVRKRARATAD